jgi:hypothetical protein
MASTEIEDRDAELLEPWLGLTTIGKSTALSTVRGFVDTVERAVPDVGLAERRKVIDAALEMTQGLLRKQYGFVRGAVRSAVFVDVDVNVGVDVDVASRKQSR